jgi:hypothetical protein
MQVCEGEGYMQHLLYNQSYFVAEIKKKKTFKVGKHDKENRRFSRLW